MKKGGLIILILAILAILVFWGIGIQRTGFHTGVAQQIVGKC